MTTYEGQCHCGQTTWTTKIPEEKHILWHVHLCLVGESPSRFRVLANPIYAVIAMPAKF